MTVSKTYEGRSLLISCTYVRKLNLSVDRVRLHLQWGTLGRVTKGSRVHVLLLNEVTIKNQKLHVYTGWGSFH